MFLWLGKMKARLPFQNLPIEPDALRFGQHENWLL